ncbi:MAG: hypothetical protein ACLQA5_06290, partial [Solirubrobacteraceae bacterium]
MPTDDPHRTLDVVELLTASGRGPAGTVGTVVEAHHERVLVEIAAGQGHGLDFIGVEPAPPAFVVCGCVLSSSERDCFRAREQ